MKADVVEEKERIKTAEMILHYRFKSKNILLNALMRRDQKISVMRERGFIPDAIPDTQRTLAMMGDKVLDLCLYEREYDPLSTKPGDLDSMRQDSARNDTLSGFTNELFSLESCVIWSENERKEEIWNNLTPQKVATILEALLGSIYLDAHKRGRDGVTEVDCALEKMKFWDYARSRSKSHSAGNTSKE
jgi:dsRNA-specific ribonuclease